MRTLGIVGGIAPGSTIDYYRLLVAGYRERTNDGSYPRIVIDSIDMTHMLSLIEQPAELVACLASSVASLARAGAEFALFASNTPHLVFDEVVASSPVPLLSIVEAAADATVAIGARRVGILGARFSVEAELYPRAFARRGIEIVRPDPENVTRVHDLYVRELINGVFTDETRRFMSEVATSFADVDAVVLAGTELPLLLRDAPSPVPMLDTTQLHVDAALEMMLRP